MKKIFSIFVSILLTIAIFVILHLTKLLLYNNLPTYYISFAILLGMFLLIFLKVFNFENKMPKNIPIVDNNVENFYLKNKQKSFGSSESVNSDSNLSSQKANFDLSPNISKPVEPIVSDIKQEISTQVDINEPVVEKPEEIITKQEEVITKQETSKPEEVIIKPEILIQKNETTNKHVSNLPYSDVFGSSKKTDTNNVSIDTDKPIEKKEVPKQNLNVKNFPKKEDSDNKKKDISYLSEFDEIK
jgi:hypothetical protein